jgi:hypothetical protein
MLYPGQSVCGEHSQRTQRKHLVYYLGNRKLYCQGPRHRVQQNKAIKGNDRPDTSNQEELAKRRRCQGQPNNLRPMMAHEDRKVSLLA